MLNKNSNENKKFNFFINDAGQIEFEDGSTVEFVDTIPDDGIINLGG